MQSQYAARTPEEGTVLIPLEMSDRNLAQQIAYLSARADGVLRESDLYRAYLIPESYASRIDKQLRSMLDNRNPTC